MSGVCSGGCQALLERIEGARADIAIDDADGAERQCRETRAIRVARIAMGQTTRCRRMGWYSCAHSAGLQARRRVDQRTYSFKRQATLEVSRTLFESLRAASRARRRFVFNIRPAVLPRPAHMCGRETKRATEFGSGERQNRSGVGPAVWSSSGPAHYHTKGMSLERTCWA